MPPEQNDEYTWQCESQIDPSLVAREEAWAHQKHLERVQQIARDDLRRRNLSEADSTVEAHWQAEYEFWHKIISEEVDRLRLNDGYEPITIDLYPIKVEKQSQETLVGRITIGHKPFQAVAVWCRDRKGARILRIRVTLEH